MAESFLLLFGLLLFGLLLFVGLLGQGEPARRGALVL